MPGSADTLCPRPSVTLTFDRLTLKLVCESLLRWRTFIPNVNTLGLWVLELFAMYATDGQTDRQTDRQTNRQTDKSNAYCFLLYGRKHNYSNDVNQSLCMRIYYSLAKGRYR